MRTVSFVDYFELEYEGSVFSKAMLAADVDNDNVSMKILIVSSDNVYSYTFFPTAICLWNTLPVDVCQLPPARFKTQLDSVPVCLIYAGTPGLSGRFQMASYV